MGHSFPSLLIQILSISVLIILYVIVTVKLFIKHKHHLEPNHIYELSILSDFVVIFTTVILEKFEWKYEGWAPYCVLLNSVRLSARLSVYADISASQVGRFYINISINIYQSYEHWYVGLHYITMRKEGSLLTLELSSQLLVPSGSLNMVLYTYPL